MEKKELAIVTYIKNFGLSNAIENFKLKCKVYEGKILLKYSQIDSDLSLKEVQECRGLILERDSWEVLSLAFKKFFNSAEDKAAKVDYDSAGIFEKCDGTMIQLYWDWQKEEWHVGTSGMAEAEGEVNEKPNTTFSSLFWETIDKYGFSTKYLVKGRTYAFELMTPYNIVVNPHRESKVALLGVRDLKSLAEFSYFKVSQMANILGIPVAKKYELNAMNAGHLIATFEGMPYTDEGYVVCDANFNRVKIKNPAYLAAHHLKSKTGVHNIMVIVKTNEIDEYGATFPERVEEMNELKVGLDALVIDLKESWEYLKEFKPKNITPKEKKKFAMKVFELMAKEPKLKQFSGLFFALNDGKVTDIDDFIIGYEDKKLYNYVLNRRK